MKDIMVSLGSQTWPVRIERQSDGTYWVYGRLTAIKMLVHKTDDGYLVALPNLQRSGEVPADCCRYDIQTFCGVENDVDALTISVAVNAIINTGGETE